MNVLVRTVLQLADAALNSFRKFPSAMLCAFAFSLVTVIRINLDWPQQEPYNFLFNCLHLSLAFGAVFSLAAITAAQTVCNRAKAFLAANLTSLLAAAIAFAALYCLGGADPGLTGYRYRMLSGIAVARVTAAMTVSFLGFVVFAAYPKGQSDFSRSSFMTLKALIVALVYGGTIMAGLSGIAGAVQALLYSAMSEKVYMYIGTLSGFLTFAIFAGYFPDFRPDASDPRRQEAEEQPRFAQILFSSILVPVMIALTLVLLVWTAKSLLTETRVPFDRLSSIASSYAIIGLWLHVMVTHHESSLARFYRRFFPFTALVILAFEARALLMQLNTSGLKTTEYWFIVVWIMAAAGSVLLLVRREKAHLSMVAITCLLAVLSVSPVVGYHALPVACQVHRLQELLVDQGMLQGGRLVPAPSEPDPRVREAITDAVLFLASAEGAKLPAWFDKELANPETFKQKLGFEQKWPEPEAPDIGSPFMATTLYRASPAVDISEYSWAVNPQEVYGPASQPVTVTGKRGSYRIYWKVDPPHGIPSLRIVLDDREILNQDMNPYLDRLTAKYPPGSSTRPQPGSLEDMTVRWETPELSILLVFNNVEISVNPREDIIYYGLNLDALYLREKP